MFYVQMGQIWKMQKWLLGLALLKMALLEMALLGQITKRLGFD